MTVIAKALALEEAEEPEVLLDCHCYLEQIQYQSSDL
jgi:hypothetical protein